MKAGEVVHGRLNFKRVDSDLKPLIDWKSANHITPNGISAIGKLKLHFGCWKSEKR